MTPWRLLAEAAAPCAARDGAWNMAADETLAESVAAGASPALRLYTWSPPCVSLGRNQPARGRFDVRLARQRGIDIVRRPTGGFAVYHGRELTYAVAVPAALFGGPRRTYHQIHRAIVNGLRRLGVAASIAGDRVGPPHPDPLPHGGEGNEGSRADLRPRGREGIVGVAGVAWGEPCFREAARGEVVAGGRKLVGSAQRRERGVILQHGSILIAGDQSPVLELQTVRDSNAARARETAAGNATLDELLGGATAVNDLAAAVIAGFEDLGGIRFAADSLTREEQRRAGQLSDRYRSEAWTLRR